MGSHRILWGFSSMWRVCRCSSAQWWMNYRESGKQLSQIQENQPKSVTEKLMDKVAHLQGENHEPVGTSDSGKKPFGGNSGTDCQRL